jgi:hypothetical protein
LADNVGTDIVHNATGIWSVSDYGSTPVFNAGGKGKVYVSEKDKKILRSLAAKVAELSARPVEKEKRQLWYDHDCLKPVRPVVFCDPENGWNEIITENQLKCTGELAIKWEMVLRKEIFWGESILDDKVIEQYFEVGYTYDESAWGVRPKMYGGTDGGSYVWDAPIKKYSDIDKIKFPAINVDYETTNRTLEVANDAFRDILKVRLRGIWWWTLGLTFILVTLRGMDAVMLDMMDKPDFVHSIMKIISEGTLKKLDFLEDNGLLSLNNESYVGSGGFGYTRELPAKGFNQSKVRTIDMWGFCDSQETIGISPKMFEEFIFPYQLPILKRFGLNCYGCCEPINPRWHIIKNAPNLRRVSVSPWANLEKMAEYLEDNYIYSAKLSPTPLAEPVMNKELVRSGIRKALEASKGCVVELLMKDNNTLGRNPGNVINWVRIAKEEIGRIYG